jgi:PPOX class probable F420-dependent enzyme
MTILDPSEPKHAAAQQRLQDEKVIWLTTVAPSGQPQSTPVWFLWADGGFLIYGAKNSPKIRNIEANPRIGLHLEGNGQGGGNVIFEATARLDPDGATTGEETAYLARYQQFLDAYGWSAETMARAYPHVIRAVPTRARIW